MSGEWVQPPLFCVKCNGTGTVPRKRDGQPMICPWCDPARKRP